MKKIFTFLLMALLALTGFKSWGQESQTITIGTQADTNQDMPFNGYYKYSYAQMLYLGSEIGESGTITSISFYVNYGVSKDYTLDVYMKCVDKSEFSHGDDWVSVTTEDLVYQTEFFRASSTGWKTITLTKPFQYNSDQNLMIAFDNNTGSYSNAHKFGVSFNGATGIYQRDDNLNISPFDPYNGSLAYYRPIIQITMLPAQGNTINYATLTGGTISGPSKAEEGATVTLSATPAHGYDFVQDSWVVTKSTGGTVDVTNNQFTMPDCDVTVSATFTAQPHYTVNVTNPTDGGSTTATLSATPSTNVLEGDEVRLNYSDLAEGYKFVNYVATNASTSEPVAIQQKWDGTLYQNYYCFTMPDADVNLTANVKLIRTIYVAEMQHGRLSINPNPQYEQITAGETITISPTPDYGYALESLTITKVSGGTITPEQQEQWGQIIYTFEMPEDDVNIAATFASTGTLYTVTLPEETEIGSIYARNAETYQSSTEFFENDQVCIYGYVYNSNYYLKSVVVKKNSDQTVVDFYQQEGNNYYFIMPADNVTVTATFEEKPRYTVNIPAFTGGTVTASETSVMANTMVYLDYAANDGYTFAGITIKKDSDMSEVYYYDGSWYGHSYYFYMPEDNVTVNATFNELPHSVTVYEDWTTTNTSIPINGYNADNFNYSKSQFIIPKTELQEMEDGKITNLTLYTNFNQSFTGTWNIYVMEVADGTTLSSSFVSLDGVDPVYSGNLTASSNELSIDITPYQYQGGNLLVCFNQTSTGNWSSNGSAFYGVNASNGASRYTYYSTQYSSSFLPKTTFYYTPAVKYNIAIDEEMENGTVLASAESATEGETITLTPQPEAGYGLTAWNVTTATGSVTVNDNNQFTMPASDVTVSATFGLLDRYTVTVNQPTEGATLSVDPTTDWYEGLEVKLNCELTTGYQFGDWIVTSESTPLDVLHNDSENYDYFVMPAANVNVTATINKVYAISIDSALNGQISTYPANNAAVGTQVEVYAIPDEGYYLESLVITDQSGEVEHDAYNRFIMPASDVIVTATFSNAHYSITLNEPENGTLTANIEDLTDVLPTSYVTFTATPATHYHLSSLTIMANGQEVPVVSQWENNYIIEMPAGDVEVTATFEEDAKYTVTLVYNEDGGSINVGSSTEFYAGDAVYVYFTIETGYILNSLEAEDSNQNAIAMSKYTNFYKFDMPEDNVTVTAEFVHGITVNDGISTNEIVPIYGYNADANTKSQFIIPEASLVDMKNGKIESMVFYLNNSDNHTFNGNWKVYIKVVNITTLSNYETLSADEKVYEGDMVITNGKMTLNIPEEKQCEYRGGNLLIGFEQTQVGNWLRTYWMGVNQSSNTAYAGYSSWGYDYSQARQFLPKVTFLYEPGEPLPEYNITFHSNGIVSEQTLIEGLSLPNPTNIPAGLTFAGWAAADIATYTEEEPEYITAARAEEDLYAVFSYSEAETTSKGAGTWIKVTDVNELANNDKVVLVYSNMIVGQRGSDEYSFTALSNDLTIVGDAITNIPDNAIEFTLQQNGDYWNLNYYDAKESEETSLAFTDYMMVPASYGWGSNKWIAESNSGAVVFKTDGYTRYIGYNANVMKVVNSSGNKCNVYKAGAPVVTKTYYMTEVFTNGSITADTEVKNIITTGTVTVNNNIVLTMNESGLFRNENAAKFVFKDGAQLIYTGEETVNATFEKNIIGYNNVEASDGWYFIANPTDNPTVNLSGGTSYDLYIFNPAAAAEWQNAQYENNVPIENIEISRETGYLYANSADFTLRFEGELIPSGEETINLVYAEEGTGIDFPGFNLVGNPFPCTAYISSDFDLYKLDKGSEVVISEDFTMDPCEAFFVEATVDNQEVTISTTAPTGKSYAMPIVVNSDRGETLDRAILHLEGTRNSHKFMMNPDRTNISFAKNGERFASVSRGDETEIPMNFTADHKGSYTISFNTENFEEEYLHLIDVVSGDNIDLLVTPSYTFEADADEYASRFRIVFGTTDINDDPATSSEPFVYISNGNLVINNVEGTASMQIVDMLGRIVRTETVCGSYNKPHNLKAGAYVITLDGRSQRIVIE
ncbi:MAG: hypothetical protein MJZ56_05190 [Bacteroidales bacterium]|nr:hypothetical protein [Bacteroidales bacterium]